MDTGAEAHWPPLLSFPPFCSLARRFPCADSVFLVLCHERLSIVGVGRSHSVVLVSTVQQTHNRAESGAQPLTNADESIVLAVNGEIYNHRLLRKSLKKPYHFKTTSDCEVIIPLVCCSAY